MKPDFNYNLEKKHIRISFDDRYQPRKIKIIDVFSIEVSFLLFYIGVVASWFINNELSLNIDKIKNIWSSEHLTSNLEKVIYVSSMVSIPWRGSTSSSTLASCWIVSLHSVGM